VILHAPSYPSSPTSSNDVPQSINITVLCATETSDWEFVNYDGSQAQVKVSAPGGCTLQGQPEGDKDDEKTGDGNDGSSGGDDASHVGSGIGWFFLVYVSIFSPFTN
jgi:autophagy-related protein 27